MTDWMRYARETKVSFPGESAEYRAARDRLLAREAELRRLTEEVAAARRELPPGGEVPEDYLFEGPGPDGAPTPVRMSELFEPGKDTLLIYSFMFGPEREAACPFCTAGLHLADPTARQIAGRVSFAVVAESPLPRILAHAERQDWQHLRLLSTAGNSYNRDYYGKTAEGSAFFQVPEGETWEMPIMNVFRRDGDTIRHFWASELLYAPAEPGQDPRHFDAGNPVMSFFDLTPEGRPMPGSYEEAVAEVSSLFDLGPDGYR